MKRIILTGAQGTGKTTILNLLGGMDKASGGVITVDGENVTSYSKRRLTEYRRRDIGFVFQFYNLIPNLTALENVELMKDIVDININGLEVLDSVGLKDHANQFPAQLSGGEQQRVSIARAVAKQPTMLLCDEPTGNLDFKTSATLLKFLKENKIKHKILGNGSNLLFSDKTYNGVLIRLNEFDKVDFLPRNKIIVGAGYSLMKLSLQASKKGLAGLEFAAGIPGTVGGAIYMNAGAYKSDMGYIVQQVKVLTPDLKVITLSNKEMNFHYRSSFLQSHPGYICLEVVLKLTKGDKDALDEVIKERRKRRMESQPLEFPSAGSVFRNPEGMFAGQLIEEAGLKGKKIGGAMVSDKHANFIVNYDNATSEDIKYVIDYCHDEVLKKYGVELKIEQGLVLSL